MARLHVTVSVEDDKSNVVLLAVVGFVLGVIVGAALVVLATAAAAVASERATPLVVTTANVWRPLGEVRARRDVARAARGGDVVLTQEMMTRHPGRVAPPGWRYYRPARPKCKEHVTYWRPGAWVRVTPGRAVRLDHATYFPGGQRCASVIVLRHREDRRACAFVSVHLAAHVEHHGRPYRLPRVRAYTTGMRRLVVLLDHLDDRWRCVIVGGDWNVDYYADRRVRWHGFPFANLGRLYNTDRGTLPRTAPTLHRRTVDNLWWRHRPGRVSRPVASRTITGTYSDHNFARVRLRLVW